MPPLGETGEDSPAARALAGEIVATPDFRYEYPAAGKRGWARAIFSPLRDASGKITGIIGVVQEITARIKTLLRIKAANRLYAISAHVSATASVVHELEALLAETCRIAVDGDTVSMAWIGLFDHAAGILRPVAQAGTGGNYQRGDTRSTVLVRAAGWPVTRFARELPQSPAIPKLIRPQSHGGTMHSGMGTGRNLPYPSGSRGRSWAS